MLFTLYKVAFGAGLMMTVTQWTFVKMPINDEKKIIEINRKLTTFSLQNVLTLQRFKQFALYLDSLQK